MPYAAYNKLYKHGKVLTKVPFRNAVGKTAAEARARSNRANKQWNKLIQNKNYGFTAKTFKVKKVKR